MQLDKERVMKIVKAALSEDIGRGDVTTFGVIDKTATIAGVLLTREDCAACGVTIAEWIFSQVDPSVRFKANCKDGDYIGAGREIAFVEGHAASLLKAERTAINFVSFLSGVATATKRYVDKARPYGVKIMDTRKTLPLLRYLEKYAVRMGGGHNHRMGLFDQVLIKDNHIGIQRRLALSADGRGVSSIKDIVLLARKKAVAGTVVEVEVTSPKEFSEALIGKPDIVMLDNMTVDDVRSCVALRKRSAHKPLLEVSGGIHLDTVEAYARCEVDMISVGAITNSVKAVDMALELS